MTALILPSLISALALQAFAGPNNPNTDWFRDARYGVFMHFLSEGLAGLADRAAGNNDGRVSLLELYKYAGTKTKAYVAQTFSEVQTPMLKGEVSGDFEIGLVRKNARGGP